MKSRMILFSLLLVLPFCDGCKEESLREYAARKKSKKVNRRRFDPYRIKSTERSEFGKVSEDYEELFGKTPEMDKFQKFP